MRCHKRLRIVAGLTIIAFLATNHFGLAVAHAQAIHPESVMPTRVVDISHIQLPQEFGEVVESWQGKNPQTVILIQDAHSIPDAQKNIANLIKYFERTYGIHSVALEGASGDLDPQIFKSFPNKKLMREVFKTYFDAGEIAGGTAAAIFNDNVAEYRGVEDWEKYQDGLALYLEALKKSAGLLEKIQADRAVLTAEKEKIYSKELLATDHAIEKFRANGAEIGELLKVLGKIQAPDRGGDLEAVFKEIQKGQQTKDNRPQTKDIEVREIAKRIEKFLKAETPRGLSATSPEVAQPVKRDELKAFNSKKQQWMTGAITPEAFGLYLKETAEKFKLNINMSGELLGMVREQRRLKELEGTKLFRELEEYIQSVKQKLIYKTSDNRLQKTEDSPGVAGASPGVAEISELDKRTEELRMVEKLVKLELFREEWNKLKANVVIPAKAGIQSKDLVYHLSFYANAEERDQIFFENLMAGKENKTQTLQIMVAGGFHAAGLTQRLKEARISYVLVMPKIKQIPEHSAYQAQMRGEVSWKNYFEVENGRINLYKAFVRATRDKLVTSNAYRVPGSDSAVLKSWRDQIIRDLSVRGEIVHAARYTRFIDEILDPTRGTNDAVRGTDALMVKVEKFIDGLFNLQKQNQFTSQNISNLLRTTALPPRTAISIAPYNLVEADPSERAAAAITQTNLALAAKASTRTQILEGRIQPPTVVISKPNVGLETNRSEMRKALKAQKSTQGYMEAVSRAHHLFRYFLNVIDVSEADQASLLKAINFEFVLGGNSYAHVNTLRLDGTDASPGAASRSLAHEFGHILHNHYVNPYPSSEMNIGVMEALAITLETLADLKMGRLDLAELDRDAAIGELALDYFKLQGIQPADLNNLNQKSTDENIKMLREIIQHILNKQDVGTDIRKQLINNAHDFDYGFFHYVGAAIYNRVRAGLYGKNTPLDVPKAEKIAKVIFSSLKNKNGVDFLDPHRFADVLVEKTVTEAKIVISLPWWQLAWRALTVWWKSLGRRVEFAEFIVPDKFDWVKLPKRDFTGKVTAMQIAQESISSAVKATRPNFNGQHQEQLQMWSNGDKRYRFTAATPFPSFEQIRASVGMAGFLGYMRYRLLEYLSNRGDFTIPAGDVARALDGALNSSQITGATSFAVVDLVSAARRSEARPTIALSGREKEALSVLYDQIHKNSEMFLLRIGMTEEIFKKFWSGISLVLAKSKMASTAHLRDNGATLVVLRGDPFSLGGESETITVAHEVIGHALHNFFHPSGEIDAGIKEAYAVIAELWAAAHIQSQNSKSAAAQSHLNYKKWAKAGDDYLDFLKTTEGSKFVGVSDAFWENQQNWEELFEKYFKFLASRNVHTGNFLSITHAMIDAQYGFDHFVGYALIQRLAQSLWGNDAALDISKIEFIAKLMYSALSEPSTEWKDPTKFVDSILAQNREWVAALGTLSLIRLMGKALRKWIADLLQSWRKDVFSGLRELYFLSPQGEYVISEGDEKNPIQIDFGRITDHAISSAIKEWDVKKEAFAKWIKERELEKLESSYANNPVLYNEIHQKQTRKEVIAAFNPLPITIKKVRFSLRGALIKYLIDVPPAARRFEVRKPEVTSNAVPSTTPKAPNSHFESREEKAGTRAEMRININAGEAANFFNEDKRSQITRIVIVSPDAYHISYPLFQAWHFAPAVLKERFKNPDLKIEYHGPIFKRIFKSEPGVEINETIPSAAGMQQFDAANTLLISDNELVEQADFHSVSNLIFRTPTDIELSAPGLSKQVRFNQVGNRNGYQYAASVLAAIGLTGADHIQQPAAFPFEALNDSVGEQRARMLELIRGKRPEFNDQTPVIVFSPIFTTHKGKDDWDFTIEAKAWLAQHPDTVIIFNEGPQFWWEDSEEKRSEWQKYDRALRDLETAYPKQIVRLGVSNLPPNVDLVDLPRMVALLTLSQNLVAVSRVSSFAHLADWMRIPLLTDREDSNDYFFLQRADSLATSMKEAAEHRDIFISKVENLFNLKRRSEMRKDETRHFMRVYLGDLASEHKSAELIRTLKLIVAVARDNPGLLSQPTRGLPQDPGLTVEERRLKIENELLDYFFNNREKIFDFAAGSKAADEYKATAYKLIAISLFASLPDQNVADDYMDYWPPPVLEAFAEVLKTMKSEQLTNILPHIEAALQRQARARAQELSDENTATMVGIVDFLQANSAKEWEFILDNLNRIGLTPIKFPNIPETLQPGDVILPSLQSHELPMFIVLNVSGNADPQMKVLQLNLDGYSKEILANRIHALPLSVLIQAGMKVFRPSTTRSEMRHGQKIDLSQLPRNGKAGRLRGAIEFLKSHDIHDVVIVGSLPRSLFLTIAGDTEQPEKGEIDLILRDRKQVSEISKKLGKPIDVYHGDSVVIDGWVIDIQGWFTDGSRTAVESPIGASRNMMDWPAYSLTAFGISSEGEWFDPFGGLQDLQARKLRWMNPQKLPLTFTGVMRFLGFYHSYHKKKGFELDEAAFREGEQEVRQALAPEGTNRSTIMRSMTDGWRGLTKIRPWSVDFKRAGFFKKIVLFFKIILFVHFNLLRRQLNVVREDLHDGYYKLALEAAGRFAKSLLLIRFFKINMLKWFFNKQVSAVNLTAALADYSGLLYPQQAAVNFSPLFIPQLENNLPWGIGIYHEIRDLMTHAEDPIAALDHFIELGGGWVLELAGLTRNEIVSEYQRRDNPRYMFELAARFAVRSEMREFDETYRSLYSEIGQPVTRNTELKSNDYVFLKQEGREVARRIVEIQSENIKLAPMDKNGNSRLEETSIVSVQDLISSKMSARWLSRADAERLLKYNFEIPRIQALRRAVLELTKRHRTLLLHVWTKGTLRNLKSINGYIKKENMPIAKWLFGVELAELRSKIDGEDERSKAFKELHNLLIATVLPEFVRRSEMRAEEKAKSRTALEKRAEARPINRASELAGQLSDMVANLDSTDLENLHQWAASIPDRELVVFFHNQQMPKHWMEAIVAGIKPTVEKGSRLQGVIRALLVIEEQLRLLDPERSGSLIAIQNEFKIDTDLDEPKFKPENTLNTFEPALYQSPYMTGRIKNILTREENKKSYPIMRALTEALHKAEGKTGLPWGKFFIGRDGRLTWEGEKLLQFVAEGAPPGLYEAAQGWISSPLISSSIFPQGDQERENEQAVKKRGSEYELENPSLVEDSATVMTFFALIDREVQILNQMSPSNQPKMAVTPQMEIEKGMNDPPQKALQIYYARLSQIYDPTTGLRKTAARSEMRTPETIERAQKQPVAVRPELHTVVEIKPVVDMTLPILAADHPGKDADFIHVSEGISHVADLYLYGLLLREAAVELQQVDGKILPEQALELARQKLLERGAALQARLGGGKAGVSIASILELDKTSMRAMLQVLEQMRDQITEIGLPPAMRALARELAPNGIDGVTLLTLPDNLSKLSKSTAVIFGPDGRVVSAAGLNGIGRSAETGEIYQPQVDDLALLIQLRSAAVIAGKDAKVSKEQAVAMINEALFYIGSQKMDVLTVRDGQIYISMRALQQFIQELFQEQQAVKHAA